MDAILLILQNIHASAAGLVPILYTLLVASGLDVLTGAWAAWKSGSFESKFFLEFIRSHIVTKVTPIMLLLLAGVSMGGVDTDAGKALVATGGMTALAYLGVMAASIRNNVVEGRNETKGLPTGVETAVVLGNPFNSTPLTDVASPDEV